MAASTEVVLSPSTGYYEWERPEGVAHFTEFALTRIPPYHQVDLQYENPFCRVAARTATGLRLCEQGCGMDCAAQPPSHECPFGLTMVQASASVGAAVQWVGRRFTDVDAMHAALDRLAAEGIDEDLLLASLPPNPLVTIEELREAAEGRGGRARIVSPVATPAVTVEMDVSRERAAESSRVCDLLEYLEQVHRLLAGATRPEAVCERFLRAVAAVAPFEEMAIYLRRPENGDWVIATLADASGRSGQSQPGSCRLEDFGAAVAAATQRGILTRQHGCIEPFAGRLQGEATLALPFPLAGGDLIGVWLAHQNADPRPCALGDEVVRYMRLLAEFLGARLHQLSELATAQKALPTPAVPDQAALTLADALCAEVSRGARQRQPFTLLCLQGGGATSEVEIPGEALSEAFASVLRPYDTLVNDPQSPHTWFAVLPYARQTEARMVAARLITVFEDTMDTRGGTEELGVRLSVGGSVWGSDTIAPEEMILHASQAVERGTREEFSSVHFFGEAAEARTLECSLETH